MLLSDQPNMAMTTYSSMVNPITVISPQFVLRYPMDLIMMKDLIAKADGNFAVTDVHGNIIFRVKGKQLSARRVILDASGNPIVSLRQKTLSIHGRWNVYRGDSSNSKHLLFSARKSSMIQFRTELDVFLASNKSECLSDFKIIGCWLEKSCVIYAGNSTIIAQMHKQHTVQSVAFGQDTFSVTVYPQVDYAFIVALVVILNEINQDRDS